MPKKTDLLNKQQENALREAIRLGAGHAAIAMSQMLGKTIGMAVTRTGIVPNSELVKDMMGKKKNAVGIYIQTIGDIEGVSIFLFDKRASLVLSDILLGRGDHPSVLLDEKAQSALRELGNILTGAFISALSDKLHLDVFHKTPFYVYDDADIVVSGICRQIFGDDEDKFCIATEIIETGLKLSGIFIFVPTPKAMTTILEKLESAE
jgi:chemotaxis protein CheC